MVAAASDRQPAIIETPARSAAASTAATVAESIKDFGNDMKKAGAQIDSAVDAVAAPVERAVGVVAGAVAGLANLAEGVGDAAERMIDGIAGFLGGGSSAPPPKQEAVSAQEPPVKQTLAERIAAFREAEKQRRQEIARGLGARDAPTEEELQREKEAQEKRSRDRGGGIHTSHVEEGSSSTRRTNHRPAHIRIEQNRTAKREALLRRVSDGVGRSLFLGTVGRAVSAIAARQFRRAEFRFRARLNPFKHSEGGGGFHRPRPHP